MLSVYLFFLCYFLQHPRGDNTVQPTVTGPQQDCSQLLPLCDEGTYPDCTGGCQITPIDPNNPHTFIVDERPDGVPNDPHFIFTDEYFSPLPLCWDFLNDEGELKEFDPNAFGCQPIGDNDIFVFAWEGLLDPFPLPAPCGDCDNPPLMRGCPTRYGWFFDIDSDRDGSYDDMEVAFLDAGRDPLNFYPTYDELKVFLDELGENSHIVSTHNIGWSDETPFPRRIKAIKPKLSGFFHP